MISKLTEWLESETTTEKLVVRRRGMKVCLEILWLNKLLKHNRHEGLRKEHQFCR